MWDSRNGRGRHGVIAASVVPPQHVSPWVAALPSSRVFDIREHLPGQLDIADVHVKLHGASRGVEAAAEPAEPDQILQTLALDHERYVFGFERRLSEREGDRVCGLEDGHELASRPHEPGYLPKKSSRNPTVSIVP